MGLWSGYLLHGHWRVLWSSYVLLSHWRGSEMVTATRGGSGAVTSFLATGEGSGVVASLSGTRGSSGEGSASLKASLNFNSICPKSLSSVGRGAQWQWSVLQNEALVLWATTSWTSPRWNAKVWDPPGSPKNNIPSCCSGGSKCHSWINMEGMVFINPSWLQSDPAAPQFWRSILSCRQGLGAYVCGLESVIKSQIGFIIIQGNGTNLTGSTESKEAGSKSKHGQTGIHKTRQRHGKQENRTR